MSMEDRDGFIWLDGRLMPWRDCRLHVLTHALHYGSAVFEGERIYDGRVFRLAALRYEMDLPAAVAALAEAGLAHTALPDDRCLPAFDVPALREACKRLALPTSGPRPALVDRLRGKRWVAEAPTHHYALGVGHHAQTIKKVADVLGIESVIVSQD